MLLRKGIAMWIIEQCGRSILNLDKSESIQCVFFARDNFFAIRVIGIKNFYSDTFINVFKGGEPECERIFQAITKAITSGDNLFSIPEFHEKYLNATNGNEE